MKRILRNDHFSRRILLGRVGRITGLTLAGAGIAPFAALNGAEQISSSLRMKQGTPLGSLYPFLRGLQKESQCQDWSAFTITGACITGGRRKSWKWKMSIRFCVRSSRRLTVAALMRLNSAGLVLPSLSSTPFIGESGGFRSAQFAGMDPRVKCAFVDGWVTTYGEMFSYRPLNTHYHQFIAGAYAYLYLPDLVSMCCPGALMVIHGRKDCRHYSRRMR